jgi:hypothetical protein
LIPLLRICVPSPSGDPAAAVLVLPLGTNDTNSSTGQKLRSAPSSLLTLGTVSDPNTFCQAQHIVTIHARLREVFSRVCEGAANLLPSPFQAPRASPGATELQQVALTAKQLTAKPGLDDSPDFKGTPSPYAPSPALPSVDPTVLHVRRSYFPRSYPLTRATRYQPQHAPEHQVASDTSLATAETTRPETQKSSPNHKKLQKPPICSPFTRIPAAQNIPTLRKARFAT